MDVLFTDLTEYMKDFNLKLHEQNQNMAALYTHIKSFQQFS